MDDDIRDFGWFYRLREELNPNGFILPISPEEEFLFETMAILDWSISDYLFVDWHYC